MEYLARPSGRVGISRAGQRTKDALAVKRAEGVRLGRPRMLSPEITERVWRMHRRGASLRKIAARFNADEVPTAHGGARWHASTVSAVLESVKADRTLRVTLDRPGRERVI